MMSIGEGLGRAVGFIWGPAAGVGARIRHARLLHPDGVTYRGHCRAAAGDTPFARAGQRLEGPFLARLSTSMWRGGREWPDVLGFAVRLRRREEVSEVPDAGDQDLLFSTLRSFATLPFAPLSTDVHDWLANDYYGVSPFEVEGLGRVQLRAAGPRLEREGEVGRRTSRVERLARAARERRAFFTLEAYAPGSPGAPPVWMPLASLELEEEVRLAPARLRFDPFRDGRGIHPRGFTHALRRGTYSGSQLGRR